MTTEAAPPAPNSEEQSRVRVERMKASIRMHVLADHSDYCGTIWLPDAAFIPIEITGDELPELALLYSKATCTKMGASGFSSTGGSLVQFWTGAPEGGAHVIAGAHMEGFTPGKGQIATMQHGSACGLPGAAGCLVTYRWNKAASEMEVAGRQRGDGPRREPMAYRAEGQRREVEGDGRTDARRQLARMRAFVRQDAQLNYGERCGPITLPDHAFHGVDVTGDGFPELAVSLGRADCPTGGANSFEGTGGPLIQIWRMNRAYDGRDGPIRLLLEAPMRGFTPRRDGLIALQHGIVCPGGAGPSLCRITYKWDERLARFDATERKFEPAESPENMRYGRRELSWVRPH